MRIISKFHDYYDCIGRTDFEKTPLYVRNETHSYINGKVFPDFYYDHGSSRIIGFCGKVYPVYQFQHMSNYTAVYDDYFCYNVDEVDAVMAKNKTKKDLADYHKYRRKSVIKTFDVFNDFNKKDLSKIFDGHPIFEAKSNYNYFDNSYQREVYYDCYLKRYDFMRIMPPQQAYQEINMFLGNIAEPRKNIPYISDVVMAEAKGFNKFSFRKDKTIK